MSDDVSALLDIASAPEPVTEPTPEPSEPEVDAASPDSATEADDASASQGDAAPSAAPDDEEKPVDGRTNPAAIRSALKALRDSDPKNASIARELNNAYGRYNAYRDVFPKVADAQAARTLLDGVGGPDGFASLQETVKSVNETDALLYAGDGKVISNLWDDFVKEGKQGNFGKLAAPFLDTLREKDDKAYFETMKPHFLQGLIDVNLPGVLGALSKALAGDTPDLASAKAVLDNMKQWYDGLRDSVETGAKAKLDPDRQAFERERTEYQTGKQKDFQTGVATACEQTNNEALGKELKSYLKLPFFKGFSEDSLSDLANGLKGRLHAELQADKVYRSQMDAFWSAKSPDKAKIQSYHASKVNSIARNIVKTLLNTRYPNYGKGSVAAGAAASKKPVAAAQPVDPNAPVKPSFVPSKPADHLIDWERDPDRMLFITGKAYLKGSSKLVSWNPKWK